MNRLLATAIILLSGVSAPAAAVATTATASATILEPALVPTIAALPADIARDATTRLRQVNTARADLIDAGRERKVWPIVIEFE